MTGGVAKEFISIWIITSLTQSTSE